MTRKIFGAILAAVLSILLLGLALTTGVLYEYFYTLQDKQLSDELALTSTAVEQSGLEYLTALPASASRLTWIAADGTVLFDSYGNAADMDNHADREEISSALQTGEGTSVRYSSTFTEKMLYHAHRLADGTVLRLSMRYATVPALVNGMMPYLLLVLTLAFLCSLWLARRLSQRIVAPLNSLNLDDPLANNAYDELSPLLTRMAHQYQQIDRQKAELSARQNEFLTVIRSMNEGLVLLNHSGTILSVNPAALAFLGADDSCIGQDFLSVERHHRIDKTLRKAADEGRSETEINRNGRVYQLSASRIMEGAALSGVVLLIVDVTDRLLAERSRREFTANVSHELKTPLHTIMGSAELIENGLVQAEDLPGLLAISAAKPPGWSR